MLTRINYQEEFYVPNYHREFILRKLNEFNAAESNLFLTDATKLISNLGANIFFHLISLTGYLAYPIAGALLYYSALDREQYRKPFFKELAELFKLYEWCCRTGGEHITYDDTFLRLLDTIAPYAEKADILVPKDLDYSPQFKQILGHAPQYVQFFEQSKPDSKPFYSIFVSSQPKPKPVSTYKPKESPQYISNIKWRLYHFNSQNKPGESKQSPEDQLAKMVTNATTFISKLTH